jgi:hypothetical protein
VRVRRTFKKRGPIVHKWPPTLYRSHTSISPFAVITNGVRYGVLGKLAGVFCLFTDPIAK